MGICAELWQEEVDQIYMDFEAGEIDEQEFIDALVGKGYTQAEAEDCVGDAQTFANEEFKEKQL